MLTNKDTKPTPEQKKLYDVIKKYCKIKVGERKDKTKGEIEITRIRVREFMTFDNNTRVTCTINIKYRGTIDRWGTKMGPKGKVLDDDNRWLCKWGSTIQRNKTLRSQLSMEIINMLKYFGVNMEYKHMLTIEKIDWKE